jgi:hypothetical protein
MADAPGNVNGRGGGRCGETVEEQEGQREHELCTEPVRRKKRASKSLFSSWSAVKCAKERRERFRR